MADADTNKLLLIIIAILIPPLAVFLKQGFGGAVILNIVLWIILPIIGGVLHALWVVLK